MEEQTERKAAVTVPEEPIKAEGAVGSPGTSERSDGSSSPPPNCSICLGKLVNTSFTDSCLHQFCFTCLLQWSKIKTECPLCKQTFKSIIHNVRSEEDYDQYHVPRELASQVAAAATLDVNFDIVGGVGTVGVGSIGGNWDIGVRRFMYRSTMGNPGRRFGMVINPHEVARREQIPSIAPQLSRDERRRRQINPSDFRRNVYRHGVWASPLPDFFGGFRECSAEFYRRHPGEVSRLVPWLNRELQVLLNNNAPHVAYVMRVITDALSRYDIRTAEFRNLVRPYFGIHTEHFVHELVNFARTNYDMVGYDQSVIYLPSRGLSNEYVPRILSSPVSSSSSMTSDDSDVRVVDEPVGRREINIRLSAVVPQSIDMPGPSTVGRAFHPYTPYNIVPDVVTVSSSSSGSEDECEVVGYVKPRHERTPEIIDLSNSESEVVIPQSQPAENIKPPIVSTIEDDSQPSTSHEVKRQAVRKVENVYPSRMLEILSSSSYSESDSDSDYSPKRKQHKVSSKKSKRLLSQTNPSSRKRKRSVAVATKSRVKSPSERMLLNSSLIYSSSESDSKHPTKRTAKKETSKRRRISVSTTDSSSEKSKSSGKSSKSSGKSKKRNAKSSGESRKGGNKQHSLLSGSAPNKESSSSSSISKTLKRESVVASNIYTDTEASSSCDSDSEAKQKKKKKQQQKQKPRVERKSRRSYSTSSSSDCSSRSRSCSSSSSRSSSSIAAERSRSSSTKTKEKSRESRRASNKSGTRNSRPKKCQARSASNSSSCESAGIIDRSKKLLPQYRRSGSDCSEREGAAAAEASPEKRDLNTSDTTTTTTTTTTTNESGEMMDKMLGYEETSSTDPSVPDLEQQQQHRYYRSRSQCSVCSDSTTRVSSKKKSKHREKRKEKTKKSSSVSSKLFFSSSSSDGNSMSSVSSSKCDAPSTSTKHSDSKSSGSSSRSWDKHRSHKKSKDSRRRRSRSNSRSKSKKKSTRQIVIDFQYD